MELHQDTINDSAEAAPCLLPWPGSGRFPAPGPGFPQAPDPGTRRWDLSPRSAYVFFYAASAIETVLSKQTSGEFDISDINI